MFIVFPLIRKGHSGILGQGGGAGGVGATHLCPRFKMKYIQGFPDLAEYAPLQPRVISS